MNILIGTVLLGMAALWLWGRLGARGLRQDALRGTWEIFCFTAPRVVVALVGAGFFAELLPQEQMERWFGPQAGIWAILAAVALGPVTPGGAFIAFAVGAAALQAGAASVPVLAYMTSWALFAIPKILAYEIPFMGYGLMWRRLAVSWPAPFVVALGAMLLLG